MGLLDILLITVYGLIIILACTAYANIRSSDPLYKDYFTKAVLVKLIGGLSFALTYTYYYTYGGDSHVYFLDAGHLVDLLFRNPVEYFEVIIANKEELEMNFIELDLNIRHPFGTTEWFTEKLISPIVLLGFKNYFATTLLMALFSFIGIWHLFLTLARRYPQISAKMAFSVLFIPSVFFWGSGIMKDSIVMGFLGLIIYYADKLSRREGRAILNGLMIALSSYVVFNVKSYVIMSLLPALVLWLVMNYRTRIRNNFIRKSVLPVLLLASVISVVYTVQFLGTLNEKYSVDSFLETAQGMQSWHYVEGSNSSTDHGRGSSYTLGEYEPTLAGAASMFLPAVNVTLFRPYFWEAKNIMMVAAALESSIILLYSFFIFLGLGFFKVLRLINEDAFLLMSLSFALLFAFAVGFSSYNFGALVRYKIPCIPFYLSALFILQFKVQSIKEEKRKRASYLREKARKASGVKMPSVYR